MANLTCLIVLDKSYIGYEKMFPARELNVPTLGMNSSHVGNIFLSLLHLWKIASTCQLKVSS